MAWYVNSRPDSIFSMKTLIFVFLFVFNLSLLTYGSSVKMNDGPSMCSCTDCVRDAFCYVTESERNIDAGIKLVMKELKHHGFVDQSEIDNIAVDTTAMEQNKCLMRKIELTTQHLFDLPPKTSNYVCNTGHVCNTDKCFASLGNMTSWKQFDNCRGHPDSSADQRNMLALYFKVLKPTLLNEIKTKTINFDYQMRTNAVRNATDSTCPPQKSLSTYHYLKMALQLTMTTFDCKKHGVKFYETSSIGCSEPVDIFDDQSGHTDKDLHHIFNTNDEHTMLSTTTDPTTDPGTKPTTDPDTEPTTDPGTEPTTDFELVKPTFATGFNHSGGNNSFTPGFNNHTYGNTFAPTVFVPTTFSSNNYTSNTTMSSRKRRSAEVPSEKMNNAPSNPDLRNLWKNKPVPQEVIDFSQKIRLLNWINFAVMGYRSTNTTCDDMHSHGLETKCGPFKDQFMFNKQALLDKMYRNVVGCSDCPAQTIESSETCIHESLYKFGMQYRWTRTWLEKVHGSILGCKAYDEQCMERKMRGNSKEKFSLAYEMIKEAIGCKKSCQGSNKILELSYPEKYLLLPAVAGMAQKCNAIKITGGGLHESEQYKYRLALSKGNNSVSNAQESLFSGTLQVEQAKIMYKTMHLVLSAPESKNNTRPNVNCTTAEQLKDQRCDAYLRKNQAELFSSMLGRITSCTKNETLPGSIKFCKHDIFDNNSCMFSNSTTKNVQSKNAELVQRLSNLVFTGCVNNANNDLFSESVMRCSYYYVLLGRTSPSSGVFRRKEGITGFKKMKTKYPQLFDTNAQDLDRVKILYKASGCDQLCPIGFKYCKQTEKCSPKWESCNPSQSKHIEVLPPMSYNSTTSSDINVTYFTNDESIVIINRYDMTNDYGEWQYNYNGKWNNLSFIPFESGVILHSESQVRYIQTEKRYGLRELHFYADKSGEVSGQIVRPSENDNIKIAIMSIHPIVMRSNFTVHSDSITIALDEDDTSKSAGVLLSDLATPDVTVEQVPLPYPRRLLDSIPRYEKLAFQTSLVNFENSRPYIFVPQNLMYVGKFYIETIGENGQKAYKLVDDHIHFDYPYAKLVFVPAENVNGVHRTTFKIYGAVYNVAPPTMINITINITSVNDAPTLTLSTKNVLPPIAYNLTKTPNLGFTVNELVQMSNVKDLESEKELGIAVAKYSSSGVGTWQYNNDGTWKDLTITQNNGQYPVRFFKGGKDLTQNVFLASGTDRIRLNLDDNNRLWRLRIRPFILVSFWDKSDGLSKGYHELTSGSFKTSQAYTQSFFTYMFRKGCDGKVGSVAKEDQCGVCGGDGQIGCDGAFCSTAKIDRCGKCTGGTTSKAFNYLLDCNKRCGTYQLGSCGKCQRKEKVRNFKDCSGTCFGRKKLDRCSVCDGGNRAVDICNICHGTNSTCGGCSVRDGLKFDQCDRCLHPDSNSFNGLCFNLNTAEPMAAKSSGGDVLTVRGAGFLLSNVKCAFVSTTQERFQATLKLVHMTNMFVLTPVMSCGNYKLECTDGFKSLRVPGFINVFDRDLITVSSVAPNRISINANVTLTVTGAGFQNTGEIQCLVSTGNQLHRLDATFVSDTSVTCDLPRIAKSDKASVYLSFSKKKWTTLSVKTIPLKMSLDIYAPAPTFVSAKMRNNYRVLELNFSSKALVITNRCSGIFSAATVSLLGKSPVCKFVNTKQMVINLGSMATVIPNDVITLSSNVVRAKGESIVEFTPETNVALTGPDVTLTPVASLEGQISIGVCDKLSLSARKSIGDGGRRMKFYWGVNFADSVNISSLHSNVTTGLTTLKAKLAALPTKTNTLRLETNDLSTGVAYNFSLYVKNYLDTSSELKYHEATRQATYLPKLKILGGKTQTIKTAKLAKIQSRARKPSCMSGENDIDYLWEIDDTSVSLDETSSTAANLYIEPGTLAGDKSYTLNLTVALKDDPSISVTVSITLTVKSTPLIAKIRGGSKRVLGFNKDIVLDGRLSSDPDKSSDDAWYTWECEDEDGLACFVLDESTDEYAELEMASLSKITVPAGSLESNKFYKFTLIFQKGLRIATKSSTVQILPGDPPVVQIKPQQTLKENVGQFVKIDAVISSTVGNMAISVECSDEDEYAYVSLEDKKTLLTPSSMTVPKKVQNYPFSLVFAQNALESGVSYKFIVYAAQSEGVGFSEVVITTNAPPSIGLLESNVDNGTALETEFTLSAVEGWDDDADDKPLLYLFGYTTSAGKRKLLGTPSVENSLGYLLPAGDPDNNHELTVFVEVFDIYGSKSKNQLTLIVEPIASVDAAAIINVMSSIDGAFTAGDLSSTLGLISSSLTTFDAAAPVYDENMGADDYDTYKEFSDELLDMKENITKNVLSMANDVMDEETQTVIIDTMSDMTKGACFTNETKLGVVNTVSNIVKKQIGTAISEKRKRRSSDETTISGKSAAEVEKILEPYENTLTASAVDNTSMIAKKVFTDLTNDLIIAMCRDISFGQPPVYAQSGIANIHTEKNLFVNVSGSSETIDLNCGSNCTSPTKVILGQTLEDMYTSWSCGIDTCSGACIGSVNYVYDYYSTMTDRRVITDVVSIVLIDPNQYLLLTPGYLASTLRLQIPLKNENDNQYFYKCQSWDASSSLWSSNYCMADEQTLSINSQSYAVCQCNQTGIVSVIAGSQRPVAPSDTPVLETTLSPLSELFEDNPNNNMNDTDISNATTSAPEITTSPPETTTSAPETTTTTPKTTTNTPATTTSGAQTTTKAPTTTALTTLPSTAVPSTTSITSTAMTSTKLLITKLPTPSRTPPSTRAEVSIVFDVDFDETVRQVGGIINLQAGMKTGIVKALNVEEWRVMNVTCKSGSIITTFSFLPPDESESLDGRSVLEDDIKRLSESVKSGTFVVKIGEKELKADPTKVVETAYYDTEVETGQSTSRAEKLVFPTTGLIALILYLAIKYNF